MLPSWPEQGLFVLCAGFWLVWQPALKQEVIKWRTLWLDYLLLFFKRLCKQLGSGFFQTSVESRKKENFHMSFELNRIISGDQIIADSVYFCYVGVLFSAKLIFYGRECQKLPCPTSIVSRLWDVILASGKMGNTLWGVPGHNLFIPFCLSLLLGAETACTRKIVSENHEKHKEDELTWKIEIKTGVAAALHYWSVE